MKSKKTHFPRPSCRLCWGNDPGTSVSGRAGSSVRRSFRRFKMAATAETSTSGAQQRRYFIKSRARTVSIFVAHSRQPRLWLANERLHPPPPYHTPLPPPHHPSKHPLRAFPPRAARGGRNIGWCYTSERVSGGYHNCWNSAFYSPRNYDRGPAVSGMCGSCSCRHQEPDMGRARRQELIMCSGIWYTSTSGPVTLLYSNNPDSSVRFNF